VRNKKLYDSWNKIKPNGAAHERIIANIQYQAHYGKVRETKKSYWRSLTPVAACVFMVLALGITVPFFIRNNEGEVPHINIPHVPRGEGNNGYNDAHPPVLSEPLQPGIGTPPLHGAPPLSDAGDQSRPVSPLNPATVLSLEEALSDPCFGRFIPGNAPPEFDFDQAWRFDYPNGDSLIAFWQSQSGRNSIRWQVSTPTDHDHQRIVSADDRERYDLSLYTIPWMDSVPRELMQYVMNPVFLAEELTLEIVKARAVQGRARSPGDASSLEINFSVLFDSAVVSLNISGASPEQVWEMILLLG